MSHIVDTTDRDSWAAVPVEEALAGSAHGGETRR
jgi:hypothetical protein